MNPEVLYSLLTNVWSIFLIAFFFGGSVFVHELGHFMAARKRGLTVERFSIGFGPRILIWRRKGIEYCISLLPFGGYAAIPQLSDIQVVKNDCNNPGSLHKKASFTESDY